MANIRELNQRSSGPFWEWVNQMNQNLPHRPGNNNNDNPWTGRTGDEGPSEQHHDEARPEGATPAAESATEKGDVDPPTPPEGVPDEDYFMFEDHPGNFPPPPPQAGAHPMGPHPIPGAWFGPGPHGPHNGPHGARGPHHGPHHHGGPGHRRGGGCAGRGRGGRGRGGGRGGFGGPGGFGPFGAGFPFGPQAGGRRGMGRGFMPLYKMFMDQLGMNGNGNGNSREQEEDGVDFEPAIDVYESPAAYVIHVSLPGAKRDDVGVTWDETRSSLTIGGVVTRGVDEQMAETLSLDERDVGVFRRVVRLGDNDNPASVNADAIVAKMEDGILKLNVPKTDSYVEVKKVQIQ